MDVNVVFIEHVFLDTKFCKTALCKGECSLGRFLHYLAELAGELKFAFSASPQGLDDQYLTTGCRPRKAGDRADRVLIRGLFDMDLRNTQEVRNIVGSNLYRLNLSFCFSFAACDLTADLSDLSLKLTQTRFLRVFRDDPQDDTFLELHILFREAVLFDLFWNDVSARYLKLFTRGVAG